MSNLQLRILTAVILGSFTLWLTYIGGVGFTLLMVAMGAAIFHEWTQLAATRLKQSGVIAGWAVMAVLATMLILEQGALATIAVLIVACVLLAILSFKYSSGWLGGGLLYAGFPMISLSLLRGDEPFGFTAIIFLFAVVWSTDIAAYFTGRSLGGPKLAPKFSPNKTWSGAIGGAAAAVAGGIFVAALVAEPGGFTVPLLALSLSIVSQMGDLGESWVKRRFGAKDSGTLLPGHGGVMDRVDGLIIAGSLLYIIGAILAEPDVPSAIFFNL